MVKVGKKLMLFFLLNIWCYGYAQIGVSTDRYDNSGEKVLNSYVNIDWQGSTYFYRWETDEETLYYIRDVKANSHDRYFKLSDLREALKKKGEQDVDKWTLYSFTPDSILPNLIKFQYKGKHWIYDFINHNIDTISKKNDNESTNRTIKNTTAYWKKFNVDSTAYIYAKGHQLYLFKNSSEFEPVNLSKDGERYYSYSTSSNNEIADTSHNSTSAVWAGKDWIVSLREDRRKIPQLAIIDNLSEPYPKLKTYKFPIPGDSAVNNYSLDIWNAKELSHTKLPIARKDDERIITPGQLINGRVYLYAPRWGESNENLYFLRRNRQNNIVELCRLTLANMEVKTLVREKIDPHLNEQLFSVHVLNGGKDILFWSERTGYGRYYHYDSHGKLLKKLGGQGTYVMGSLYDYNPDNGNMIIEVYGYQKSVNPYYKQYLMINIAGGKEVLLTKEPYNHTIHLSPDKQYFVDQYSDPQTPAHYKLKDMKGHTIADIGVSDISRLLKDEWKAPKKVEVLAADKKTKLYGLVYTPYNLDKEKKYPVIASVYPGPQDDFVPYSFTVNDNYHQSLADLGYIVVQVPSRGSSPYRGLKFHSHSYGNMRDYALEDNKLIIETLAKELPYMDLDKVGIYGHSGGGFMSATALLTYPDFYKVAVSASGNYDPNIYTQWWSETYHGLNKGRPLKNYIPTTLELAPNLKGKLLLITGDMDINVHPAHTMRLADALIKANKYFDMMVLPGKGHGLGDKYYQNLIYNYFLLHLN